MIRQSFIASAGIDPATFEGGPDDVRPAIAKAVREIQGPALGADFSDLNDAQLTDDFHYTIFPNVTLNIFGRSAWLFRHRPHPTDPNRMFFDFFGESQISELGLGKWGGKKWGPGEKWGGNKWDGKKWGPGKK